MKIKEAVKRALSGDHAVDELIDYHGNEVMAAYGAIFFEGVKWAIIAEIEVDEISHSVDVMAYEMLALLVVITILVIVGGHYIAKTISGPIFVITEAMRVIADGNVSIEIPERDRQDEIGHMSKALQVFKDNKIQADKLAEEQQAVQRVQVERAETLDSMTKEFEGGVSELINTLSSATTELTSTAQSMAGIAEETATQVKSMSNASESTGQNIQSVASAAEELTASIRELSSQVNSASQSTKGAVEDVDKATAQVEGLQQAADQIGEVVALIQDIAEKTNLLALNATIESARAGEAGKGFAVVANEVKMLAQQTSDATTRISDQVQKVQNETQDAVSAIKSIEVKIRDVDSAAASIAAAIEEQSASTEEISRNTQHSAANVQELSSNVANVNEAAQNTGNAAEQVLSASQELSKQSESIRTQISNFIEGVKTA